VTIRTRQDFLDIFRLDWAEGDELRLSLAILDFVAAHPDTAHIPYARVQELARAASLRDPLVVERVIQYLTGAGGHLLDLGAELIDETDNVHRLDNEDFELALTRGINPLTGEWDEDLKQKLFVYFRPSKLAQQVLWGSDGSTKP
jgi:hypothetical protein